MVTKADFSSGIFRISLAPDKEYRVQINIKIAMAIAPTGAMKVPSLADSITYSGARANAYQLGPPTIISKCQIAAAAEILPPVTNK
jgi:hypothetical protein